MGSTFDLSLRTTRAKMSRDAIFWLGRSTISPIEADCATVFNRALHVDMATEIIQKKKFITQTILKRLKARTAQI